MTRSAENGIILNMNSDTKADYVPEKSMYTYSNEGYLSLKEGTTTDNATNAKATRDEEASDIPFHGNGHWMQKQCKFVTRNRGIIGREEASAAPVLLGRNKQ